MIETVKIESMSYGINAIAHLKSGKCAFVRGAQPGEICDIEITEDKKNYCLAKSLTATPEVPGAPWAHIPYAQQLIYKRKNIADALTRTAGIEQNIAEELVQDCIQGKNLWNYRNKIEFRYIDNKLCMYDSLGDENTPINELAIANKSISKTPKAIVGALNYINKNNALGITRIGIRGSQNSGSIELALYTTPGHFPRREVAKTLIDATKATSIVRVLRDKNKPWKTKGVEVLSGDGFWRENLGNYKYFISAPSFFQVNSEAAQFLQAEVLQIANEIGAKKIADLYCGCGTFTIPLAKSGAKIIGVELEGSSTKDLARNLDLNNTQAEIICDDVGRSLDKIGKPDLIVVDPPKKGIDKHTLQKMMALNVEHVIYVSCDPITLARDIKQFKLPGYCLKSVQPVDMFPQTYHVETVCWLQKA